MKTDLRLRVFGVCSGLSLLLAANAGAQLAQIPRIHEINSYGNRKVPAERILREGKLRAGDPLPPSKGDLEERLADISGVVRARVEAVCCEKGDAVLFVGVEEREGPHVAFRSEPLGHPSLPEGLAESYQKYLTAQQHARGAAAPNPEIRSLEDQFGEVATGHLTELREVVREAEDPDDRAVAAAVLGFAPDKATVVDDLQYALQDPDEQVRHNTLQAIRVVALAGVRDSRIKVSPTWLIELLNSLVLADRLEATDILLTLTDKNQRKVLDQVRERALPALVEMARWDSLRYALPPFLLVGRIAGLSEQEIQRRWSAGERESVIARVTDAGLKRR